MNARTDIIVQALLGMTVVLLVAGIVVQHRQDAMGERLEALNDKIAAIQDLEYAYTASRNVDYPWLNTEIGSKKNLWVEIVAPPPPPKPKAKGPNLPQKLKGVVPSLRRQITKKGKLYVLMVTPETPRGAFMGEGEVINGVTIHKIEPDKVVFKLNFNKKDHFHEIPRV